MKTKDKICVSLMLTFAFSCFCGTYADDIISIEKTQGSGEYILYYNKTTGEKWAELKTPDGRDYTNQVLSSYNPWMEYDATSAYPRSDFPKGYYIVTKILNGAYANQNYNEVEIVNSDIKDIETNAFQNTHISQLVFHNHYNSTSTHITGPVPYYVKADYVLIADAQYEAWKNHPVWKNEDLIRCKDRITDYPYAPSENLIELDYSKQEIPREAGVSNTLYTNLIGNQFWEYSYDNGKTWTRIDSKKSYYTDENPQKGETWYRALSAKGDYIDFKINYYSRIPETVNVRPTTMHGYVEGEVTFTLDLADDDYSYQWYKKGDKTHELSNTNTLTLKSLHVSDAGEYYCVISNPLSSTKSSMATLEVERISQSISLEDFGTYSYGDEDIILPEKTDKGLIIKYQSSNTGVAQIVNGHVIHIVKPGKTNIVASQGGNENYLPANTVTKELVINKALQTPPTLTFEDRLATDGDIPLVDKTNEGLKIEYSSSNTNVAIVYKKSGTEKYYIDLLKMGVTTITAKNNGNEYYLPMQTSTELQVLPAPNSYSPNIPDNEKFREWGTSFKVPRTSSSGLNAEITSANPDVVKVSYISDEVALLTREKPGTAIVSYRIYGQEIYENIEGSVTLTVNKKSFSISVNSAETITYDEDEDIYTVPFELSIGTALPYTIISSNTDVAITTDTPNNLKILKSGVTTVTIDVPESDYYKSQTASMVLNVLKGAQEIIVDRSAIETITFLPNQSQMIPISSVATAKTEVSCRSSNENILTIENNQIVVVGVGKCTLTFSAAGDDCYESANDVLVTVEVGSSSSIQSITINELLSGELKLYLLDGRPASVIKQGIYIIRMKDGQTKKIFVK